jgi:LysM domain
MFLRRIARFIMILILLAAIFGGVGYYIVTDDYNRRLDKYNLNVTLAIETAISNSLFDATRTAESDLPHYLLIKLGQNEFLADIAVQYDTTVDVLRIANGLDQTVESGSDVDLIVPQGVHVLDPPRRFFPYTAVVGDTLESLAVRNNVPLDILEQDNPILAQRGLTPGDIVFIARLL